MAEGQHEDILGMEQDLTFQRRQWVIQRWGWGVMALVIVVSFVGLTGSGPAARTATGAAEVGLTVDYARFDRVSTPAWIDLEVADPGQDQVAVSISSEFLDSIELHYISPEPVEVRAGVDRQTYVFAVGDPNQPVRITFHFWHEELGLKSGAVEVAGGPSVTFRQFVYP